MEVKGVSILGFSPESRAQKAGMEKGDVIVQYSGIGDLTVQRLATLTTTLRAEGIPTGVILMRNGGEHSLTLPYGPLGISAMDTTIQGVPGARVGPVAIDSVVQTIQKIYLVLAVLGVLGVLGVLAGMTPRLRSFGPPFALQGLFLTTIYWIIYLGLRWRKNWGITLVLIFSALSIVTCIFNIVHPADDVRALLAKLGGLFFLAFHGYQIYFFRRADVRERFGDKGVLVV
jgi:hypothetical protein